MRVGSAPAVHLLAPVLEGVAVCVTRRPYPLRCSRAARGHPAAAAGLGAFPAPARRGPTAAPPGFMVVECRLTLLVQTRAWPSTTPPLPAPRGRDSAYQGRRSARVALDCFLPLGAGLRALLRACAQRLSPCLRYPARVDAVAAVRLAPHRHRALFSPAYLRQQQLLSSHVDSSPRQQQHVDSSPRQQHVDSSPRQQQHFDSSPGQQQLADSSPR